MGSVFVFNLERDHGIEAEEALRVWLIAAGVLELPGRATDLKINAAELTAEAESGAFLGLERAARRACTWAIAHADPVEPLGATVNRFEPALAPIGRRIRSVPRRRRTRTLRTLLSRSARRGPSASSLPSNSRDSPSPIICSTY